MAFQLPNRSVSLALGESSPRSPSPTAAELLRRGELCQPLLERLNNRREHAAFDYLARETALDVVNDCVRRIPDQQITDFLLEQMFLTASLLSSEALTGIEAIRNDLKSLGESARKVEPRAARLHYDRNVEKLGRHFFALGRRLHQLEQFMAGCPLSGSAEQLRGLYGQRVRDLSGDVRFMRQELSRWVRRFVPLNRSVAKGGEDRELLEGRIDAVVDELGLRTREVHETLSATLFEQLRVFDPSLTRQKLFRRELENVLDVGHLLDWLSNLFDRVKEFDEERRRDQLERVRSLLYEFRPEQFPSFSGVRESDQALFLQSVEELKRYEPARGTAPGNDPIQVFLLLIGNLISSLRRHHRSAEKLP